MTDSVGAGFGSVCTLATLIWPFFEGVAVMGVIFPLFVMVACEADPCLSQQRREAPSKAAHK